MAVLAGCATPLVLSEYRPAPLASPWEGRRPKLMFGGVKDHSSGVVAVLGVNVQQYEGRPLTELVGDAFLAEFRRLGVPVVATARQADAEFQVSLLETRAGMDSMGLPPLPITGVVELRITLKGPDGQALWSRKVTGRGAGTAATVRSTKGTADALNGALADAMRQVDDLFLSGEINAHVFSRAAVAQQAASQASDVDEVPSPSGRERRAHAVVIGVERYKAELPNADFAAGDAQLVGKYLTALGFPRQNVVTLVNDGASRGDIEKYVERWLPNRVQEGDAVVVYFSGHGSPNPVSGDAYLVPFDGDPTYLDQTAYPISRLYASLAKLPTKDVTVVLDSCFSGAGGRSVIAKGARPLVNARAKAAVPESLTVLTAAAANQISQSYQDKGHGLFTYFLLKALKKQGGGALDFHAAFEETASQVTNVARQEYNAEQVPQWLGAR